MRPVAATRYLYSSTILKYVKWLYRSFMTNDYTPYITVKRQNCSSMADHVDVTITGMTNSAVIRVTEIYQSPA